MKYSLLSFVFTVSRKSCQAERRWLTRTHNLVLTTMGFILSPGEMDAGMLTELQSTLPDVPIAVEIVEGSHELLDCFKGTLSQNSFKLLMFVVTRPALLYLTFSYLTQLLHHY